MQVDPAEAVHMFRPQSSYSDVLRNYSSIYFQRQIRNLYGCPC